MKVCLIHDWLVTHRGGEKVLLAMLGAFPDAQIFTLFYDPKTMAQHFGSYTIHTPPRLGSFSRLRKALLPCYPAIIESFDLEEFDLVISSSSCVAKGVITRPDALHISYIHSPMRYIWDQRSHYFASIDKIPGLRLLKNHWLTSLRQWDFVSSQRPHHLIANSSFVAKRIATYYGREADIIHPPIAIPTAAPAERKMAPTQNSQGDYYLLAGAFVPYKRLDLAIAACQQLGRKLIIAGFGPLEQSLRKQLSQQNEAFELIVSPDDEMWQQLLAGAKALLFPGLEDFGMVPVEAMALGTPVIAYGRGGALDYVVDTKTGLLFDEPTPASLAAAIERFEQLDFDPIALAAHAKRFSEQSFITTFKDFVDTKLKEHSRG